MCLAVCVLRSSFYNVLSYCRHVYKMQKHLKLHRNCTCIDGSKGLKGMIDGAELIILSIKYVAQAPIRLDTLWIVQLGAYTAWGALKILYTYTHTGADLIIPVQRCTLHVLQTLMNMVHSNQPITCNFFFFNFL